MARKILFKYNGLNQTGNAPDGYKFIGYDGYVASDKIGATVSPLGGGSGSNVTFQEEVTHSELTTLISGSLLVSGKSYLITDYKTIYIQPDWSDIETAVAVDGTLIKEGLTEPLVVTAISSNKLSPIAISTTFPTDVIYYSPNVETLYAGYDTKGKIFRRCDAVGNDISFDFRNVKFKVYPDLVYDGYRHYNNGNSPLEKYIFSNKDLQDNNYQSSVKGNIINYSVDLDYDNGHSQFGIWGFNTTFLGSQIISNKLNGFISNCCLVGDEAVADIKLTNIVIQTYIQGYLRLKSSDFSGYFRKCTFVGNTIVDNNFKSNMSDAKIAVSNFNLNSIEVFSSNIIITGTNFQMNNIKSYNFNKFNCSGGMYNNNIICNLLGNDLISSSTSSVTLFNNNNINSVAVTSFTFSVFSNNMVNSQISNVSGLGFSSNIIGPGLDIDSAVFSNSDYVIRNNFRSTSGYLSGDFSTASHIYADYDCDIFLDRLFNTKLRYMDEEGSWIIRDITD